MAGTVSAPSVEGGRGGGSGGGAQEWKAEQSKASATSSPFPASAGPMEEKEGGEGREGNGEEAEVQDWGWVMAEGQGGGGGGGRSGAAATANAVQPTRPSPSQPSLSLLPSSSSTASPSQSTSALPSLSQPLSSSSVRGVEGVVSAVSIDWLTAIDAAGAEMGRWKSLQSSPPSPPPLSFPSPALRHLSALLSSVPAETAASSSLLSEALSASLWPHLPSLYGLLSTCPEEAPSAVWTELLSSLFHLASSQSSLLLLNRSRSAASPSSQSEVESAAVVVVGDEAEREKQLHIARRYCLWSSLSACVERLWPSSLSSSSPPLPLCRLYGVAASLYPSTLSLLDRYGDQTGTVTSALEAMRHHLFTEFIDGGQGRRAVSSSSHFLHIFRSALPLLRVVVLTHSPLDEDSDDPSAVPSGLSSSSAASRLSSSATLVSYPVVVSERGLYLPSISQFSVAAVSPSHPDLDSSELQAEAVTWMEALTRDIREATEAMDEGKMGREEEEEKEGKEAVAGLISSSSQRAIHLPLVQESLLFLTRQRSQRYHTLTLPVLLHFAEALTRVVRLSRSPSTSASSSSSASLLHLLRLGLLSLFRLQSCAVYFPALLSLLSQPSNSILCMEASKIHRQRLTQQLRSGGLPSSVPSHSNLSFPSASAVMPPQSAVSLSSAAASSTSSPSPLSSLSLSPVLPEGALSIPPLLPLLSAVWNAPLPAVVYVVLIGLQRLPAPTTEVTSNALGHVLALLQEQRSNLPSSAASDVAVKVSAVAGEETTASTASSLSSSSTAPPSSSVAVVKLSGDLVAPAAFFFASHLSSLSRAAFLRLLSGGAAESESQGGGGGEDAVKAEVFRSALVTSLAAKGNEETNIQYSVTLPGRSTLRSLQLALTAEKRRSNGTDTGAVEGVEMGSGGKGESEAAVDALLSSLRWSSSLTSNVNFSALLSDLLLDLSNGRKFNSTMALLYRLLHIHPHHHSTAPLQVQLSDEAEEDEEEEEPQENEEVLQNGHEEEDGSGAALAASSPTEEDEGRAEEKDPNSAVTAVNGRKRRLEGEEEEKEAVDDGEGSPKPPKVARQEVGAEEEEKEGGGDGAESLTFPPMTEDSDAVPVNVAVEAAWTPSDLQHSASFHSAVSAFLRRFGGVEYQQLVSSVLTAFNSRLFVNDPQTEEDKALIKPAPSSQSSVISSPHSMSLRFSRLFCQFLLDAPLLPPSVWSTLSGYLTAPAMAPVALTSLRCLLTFRPPAAVSALSVLLDFLRVSEDVEVRRNAVQVAVEAALRQRKGGKGKVPPPPSLTSSSSSSPPPSFPITAAVVDCALESASVAASPSFLSDLPSISVHITIPPPPVYEEIQLKPLDAESAPMQGDEASAVPPSSEGEMDGSRDGSEAVDEARRRDIQRLILEAQRRKREFDKLTLRRALLQREKAVMEQAAEEREKRRSQRTDCHLDLLIGLLIASGHSNADVEAVTTHIPSLFTALLSFYRTASPSSPVRKAVHTALPAIIASVGPSPALLSALRNAGAGAGADVGADAVVLHCLQLLCNNPMEQSHPPFAVPSSSSPSVLVFASSSVFSLCWDLYCQRGGDGRFIIPILPILRADVVRRCLHRLVLLPPAHLKVAFTRLLKPQMSLQSKGNKLSLFTPSIPSTSSSSSPSMTPAELVVHLHRIDHTRRVQLLHPTPPHPSQQFPDPATLFPPDDSQWLKALIAACQLCYSFVDIFPPPVMVSVLTALRSDRPLSRLFLRTQLQAIGLYPSLTSFVLDITAQLLQTERQMIDQAALWEGLLKLTSITLPTSLDLLLHLPDTGVEKLMKGYTPAGEGGPSPAPPPSKASPPLLQCRAAVIAFVTANPYRVRPLLRAKVLGGPVESLPQTYPHPPPHLHPHLPPPYLHPLPPQRPMGGAQQQMSGPMMAAAPLPMMRPPPFPPMGGMPGGPPPLPPPPLPPPHFRPSLPPPPPYPSPAPVLRPTVSSSTGWSSSSVRAPPASPSLPPPHPHTYPSHPPPPSPFYPPSAPHPPPPPSSASAASPAAAPPAASGGWKSVRIASAPPGAAATPAPPTNNSATPAQSATQRRSHW